MGKSIAIISGKGGTGKTTVAINLSLALVGFGRDVTLVDGDLKTSNIGLHFGAPTLPVTLHEVIEGTNSIGEATYLHPSGLKIIPSGISLEKSKRAEFRSLRKAVSSITSSRDTIIFDTPPGIGEEVYEVLKLADESVVVTNPELASITDALKAIKIAEEAGSTVIGVVLNRVKDDGLELSAKNIEAIADYPVIAIIPEDASVKRALHIKQPLVYSYPNAKAAVAFKMLAAALSGKSYVDKLGKAK